MGADMAAGNCCCNSICRISLDDWDGNGLHTFESVSNLNTTIPSAPTGVTTLTKTDAITGTITGATNASPIVITSAGHGLSTGDQVSITGVVGNTAANGVRAIISLSSSTFSLTGSTGSGAYISGGTWKAYDGTTLDKVKYPDTSFSGATPIVDNQSNSLEVNTSFNWTQVPGSFQDVRYLFGQTYIDLVLYPTGQNYNYWMEIDYAVRYLNKTHDTSSTPTTVTDYTFNVGDAFNGMQNVTMFIAARQGSNVWIQPFGSRYIEGVGGNVWTSGGTFTSLLKSGKWVRVGSTGIVPVGIVSGEASFSFSSRWYYYDLTAPIATWPKMDLCYGAAPIYFGWASMLKGVQQAGGTPYRADRSIAQKIRIDRLCLNWIEDPTPACPCFDVCFTGSFAGGARTYAGVSTSTASIIVASGTYSIPVDTIAWIDPSYGATATFSDGTHTFTGHVQRIDATHISISTTYGVYTTLASGATITEVKSSLSTPSFTNWQFSHAFPNNVAPPVTPITQFIVGNFTPESWTPGSFCMFGSLASGRVIYAQKDRKYAAALFYCNGTTYGGAMPAWISYECSSFDQTGGTFTRSAAIAYSLDNDFTGDIASDTYPSNFTVTAIRCDGTTAPGGETGAGSCVGAANYTSSLISGTWRWANSSVTCSAGCVAPAALTSSFIASFGNPTGSGQTFITDCIPYINHAPQGVNKTISTPTANHTFTSSEFSFRDPNDWPQANFLAVKVAALPLYGILTLDVVSGGTTTTTTVVVNQYIKKTDIDASRFNFVAGPAHVATTSATLDVWKFQVQDDGGTAHDGVDTDTTQRNFSLGVRVNHAPVGTSSTIAIGHNTPYTFAIADFGFTDPNDSPPDLFYEFHIISVPTNGVLAWNTVTMHAGDAQLTPGVSLGKLVYTPNFGYTGTDTITFKVQDDGGTANSGNDTDTTARTWTLNVS